MLDPLLSVVVQAVVLELVPQSLDLLSQLPSLALCSPDLLSEAGFLDHWTCVC